MRRILIIVVGILVVLFFLIPTDAGTDSSESSVAPEIEESSVSSVEEEENSVSSTGEEESPAIEEESTVIAEESETSSVAEEESSSVTSEEEGVVFYEDEYVRATFISVSEEWGYAMLNVKLENLCDVPITVYPTDSSVDDTMIQFTAGMTMDIQPGKQYYQSWNIGSMPTEKIELALWVFDENMSELVYTDILTIETN